MLLLFVLLQHLLPFICLQGNKKGDSNKVIIIFFLFLLQCNKEGNNNIVVITFLFLFCYNAMKKATTTLIPSPFSSFFVAMQ